MRLLTILALATVIFAQQLKNSINLRPKPKARAGGADASAAAVFSFTYTAQVFVGSNSDLFTLTISVLTNDIWIMDPECKNCKLTFIQYNSTSTDSEKIEKEVSYRHSDLNIEAEGSYFKDSVKILEYNSTFYPLAVASKFVDVYGLAIDGVLGLGSDNTSIIFQMFKEGKIDKPIYSLSFLNDPLLILGTPHFLDLSLVVESQQSIDFSKSLEITRFGFRDKIVEESIPVEFSSMSSYITGPPDILEAIFKILTEEGCHYEEELLMCECESSEYPAFNFTIQGEEFYLSSHEYLIQVCNKQLGDNCFLALKSGSHWILGEPFFKGYFTEFNLETKRLTLYKTSALTMELPSPFETTEGWAAMISLGIVSIAIYIIAFLVYLKYEDYKKNAAKVESKELAHLKPRIL